MAWGFWTTYNVRLESRVRSSSGVRESSWESLEMRGLKASSSSSSRGTLPDNRLAYERRLLLGGPEWSSRTPADRNTLPRKGKEGGGGTSSTPDESLLWQNSILGGGSSSKKSEDGGEDGVVGGGTTDGEDEEEEDIYCPACHASRVSFGSLSSSRDSSRGALGKSSTEEGSGPMKSLPSPPPPPIFAPRPPSNNIQHNTQPKRAPRRAYRSSSKDSPGERPRPRSVSLGNRLLLDTDEEDGPRGGIETSRGILARRAAAAASAGGPPAPPSSTAPGLASGGHSTLVSLRSSHSLFESSRSLSSRSGKSSSSRTPSLERTLNRRPAGCGSSKCKKAHK
eukprot:TRINITY_DN6346_c0_g1_i1.p1 TRINITY_DN6346_c0_g1~~TRINITY_DN6346_c0_g1_i1.p1  ORF type:complete len:338 (-),score=124.52 TRINITY_DN6346_c0_g1_i1:183-1196(-)